MRVTRTIATTAACLSAASLSLSAPAFAGGKSGNDCASGGWQLAIYVTADLLAAPPTTLPDGTEVGDLLTPDYLSYQQRNHDALAGFASDGIDVVAIFKSVDKNKDGALCWKLPSGWDTTPPDNKAGFLSIGDNKT